MPGRTRGVWVTAKSEVTLPSIQVPFTEAGPFCAEHGASSSERVRLEAAGRLWVPRRTPRAGP